MTAPSMTPTACAKIDAELSALRRAAAQWASLPLARKISLLRECTNATHRVARRWTATAASAKGIEGTPLAGEEALSGPWAVLRALRGYVSTL
ncbi:MAG: hypothetical protein JO092_05115 [Candidatus Eremiobacteraeota bacterium]|nr:hypothetical protein [Candidatus Eremiobacteraeota bacterium]